MPPTLPETFISNYEVIHQDKYTNETTSGHIAENNVLKLFTITQRTLSGNLVHELFNQHKYYRYYDRTILCECLNKTYTDSGLPYLGRLKDLKLYKQTKTENIWFVTSNKTLFLVSFKKVTPNIPESIIERNKEYFSNTTFIGFQASEPDSKLFTVPDYCTKVPCNNLTKRAPMFFSKLLGN